MKFRAFISVDVGSILDISDLHTALEGSDARMKLVEPANMHLTLKFLGDTDEAHIGEIREVMEGAVKETEPFKLVFRGIGAFPGPHYIRVIWIGIEGGEALVEISRTIDSELNRRLRFKKERKGFSPHLTVARVKSVRDKRGLARILEDFKDRSFGEMEVTNIRLKKSVLSRGGPAYSTVEEVYFSP